jgi:hypothetical protein
MPTHAMKLHEWGTRGMAGVMYGPPANLSAQCSKKITYAESKMIAADPFFDPYLRGSAGSAH